MHVQCPLPKNPSPPPPPPFVSYNMKEARGRCAGGDGKEGKGEILSPSHRPVGRDAIIVS